MQKFTIEFSGRFVLFQIISIFVSLICFEMTFNWKWHEKFVPIDVTDLSMAWWPQLDLPTSACECFVRLFFNIFFSPIDRHFTQKINSVSFYSSEGRNKFKKVWIASIFASWWKIPPSVEINRYLGYELTDWWVELNILN